jgi:4-carboxymuconolactone decarboxylase
MTDEGPLTPRRRCLVRLSAALASGDDGRLEDALDGTADAMLSGVVEQRDVEETILQSYLFVGFPAALEAMEGWRERATEPPREWDPLVEPEDTVAWRTRGEAICERVYGRAYARLRREMRRLHPALDRWAVTEGYGKVLGRPALPLVDRELCVVALLAVRGREPQLHSHLRGALEVGAEPGAVKAALELALEAVDGDDPVASAREVWRRVRRRRAAEGNGGPGEPGG